MIDFVRGHCGWDVVTMPLEGQVAPGRELDTALAILDAPLNGGLEVGYLGRGTAPDRLSLRMVSATERGWIDMCGGMTQVIGKLLAETRFGAMLGIEPAGPRLDVLLETPVGLVPVRAELADGRAARIWTDMRAYLGSIATSGIAPLTLSGVPLLRVGHYAVIDIADLERAAPGYDFTSRRPGEALDFVHAILRAFETLRGSDGVTAMLFDARPEGGGAFRVFPRFYSADLAAAALPWEFQCGTGSMAVAAALAHRGRLATLHGECRVIFEWGSAARTPDPYGIRTSELILTVDGTRLAAGSFSHSVTEILAEGRLTLPAYLGR